MRDALFANVAAQIRFFRRNRLLLATGIIFVAIASLYIFASMLFGSTTSRFDLVRGVFDQLTTYAIILAAGFGLVLVSSHVRGKTIKLILTKPCPPEIWLVSGFISTGIVMGVLFAAILVLSLTLSLIWSVPLQPGFAFLTIEFFFEAMIVMAYVTILAMAVHPVLAGLLALILHEAVFFQLRFGALAAIEATGGNVILPVVDKLSYAMYMLLPMYRPFRESTETIEQSMRVEGSEWIYALYTGAYAITFVAIAYLISLRLLRRKSFM